MPLDGISLYAISQEVNQQINEGWVRKIYRPQEGIYTVNVWNDDSFRLMISVGGNFRIQLTEREFENPAQPPPFCMLLRKHLQGGKITSLDQRGFDRLVELNVQTKSTDSSDSSDNNFRHYKLIIELMGRNSNIILVQDDAILGAHETKRGRNRTIKPGKSFTPAPRQDKSNPLEIERDQFEHFYENPTTDQVWRVLLNNIEGFGPTLSKEVIARAGTEQNIANLTSSAVDHIWSIFQQLKTQLDNRDFAPRVYMDSETPVNWYPFPLVTYEQYETKEFDCLTKALDFFYERESQSQKKKHLREELESALDEEDQRLHGAIDNVEGELHRAHQSTEYKRLGDIIMANLSRLEKGQEQVELPDPFNEGETVDLDLDPSLTPQQNAQQYYEESKKLRRGRKKLDSRLSDLKKQQSELKQFREKLSQASTIDDLKQLHALLKDQGIIKEKNSGPKQESKSGGPRTYWVDGYKIEIGKSAKQNDNLVREASKDDFWLHVRDYAGAHVILNTDGRPDQVPDRVIRKAAQLAALNSKAKGGNNILVSYTLVKYVDKPKGAKPGLVRINNESTINVDPSEVKE